MWNLEILFEFGTFRSNLERLDFAKFACPRARAPKRFQRDLDLVSLGTSQGSAVGSKEMSARSRDDPDAPSSPSDRRSSALAMRQTQLLMKAQLGLRPAGPARPPRGPAPQSFTFGTTRQKMVSRTRGMWLALLSRSPAQILSQPCPI